MNVLYLTSDEQKIFDLLSSELKEGWSIENEEITYEDSIEKFALRLRTYKPHDPVLRVLAQELSKTQDAKSAVTVLQNTDFNNISESALLDLFYTIGPKMISAILVEMLKNVSSDEDIHDAASFSVIRHSLLSALILRVS